jgi:hypothetical protein
MMTSDSADSEASPTQSPLCQRIVRYGTEVDVQIYKDGKGGWLLEVVDEFWNSTTWDDSFATDTDALAEALKTIDTEGIAALLGPAPAGTTLH